MVITPAKLSSPRRCRGGARFIRRWRAMVWVSGCDDPIAVAAQAVAYAHRGVDAAAAAYLVDVDVRLEPCRHRRPTRMAPHAGAEP